MRFETRGDLLDLFDQIEYYGSTFGDEGFDAGYEYVEAAKEAEQALSMFDRGEATSRDVASRIDDLLKPLRLDLLYQMIEDL